MAPQYPTCKTKTFLSKKISEISINYIDIYFFQLLKSNKYWYLLKKQRLDSPNFYAKSIPYHKSGFASCVAYLNVSLICKGI